MSLLQTAWRNRTARRFSAVMACIGLAVESARVVRDTYFLTVAGAGAIPLAYVAFAVSMVAASAVYARLSSRISLSTLQSTVLLTAVVVSAGEWLFVRTGTSNVPFAYLLFCTAEMFFLFVPITAWAVINRSFEVEEGELILPGIASFGLMGTVAGGLAVRLLIGVAGPYEPFGLCVAALAMAWLLGKKPPLVRETTQPASIEKVAATKSIWREDLVRTLVCLAGPMWMLAYMIEYIYYSTMERVFPSPEELSRFLSVFSAICSAIALVVQLFLAPWLVRRFGVATAAFGYPVCLAVGALGTLVFSLFPAESVQPWGLGLPVLLVLAARVLDISFYQSLYDSTAQALYYGVPERIRVLARAVISGMVFPFSIACAGLLLELFRYIEEPIHHVSLHRETETKMTTERNGGTSVCIPSQAP